jgi:hypothetical protein
VVSDVYAGWGSENLLAPSATTGLGVGLIDQVIEADTVKGTIAPGPG